MTMRIDASLEVELHDVFNVTQVTRGSPIEGEVGADLVNMAPGQASRTHRHNFSETVLFFLDGAATVFIEGAAHPVRGGNRILIHAGEYHSVSTGENYGCQFLSVQTPPIVNKSTGFRDLEELESQ